MQRLFDVVTIGGITVSNRFVRSATWEGMASPEGEATTKLVAAMENLAAGGVGLIVMGHAYIQKAGQATPFQTAIDRDECLGGLRKVTDAVHGRKGRIVCQLAHAGRNAAFDLTGEPPWVPSELPDLAPSTFRVMSLEDIRQTVDAYAAAAARAKGAGFDGVQIHAAHGYLLSQFLSPSTNRRRDAYGGDTEGRAQIHREIIWAVRETVGKGFPILVKINVADFTADGLETADALRAALLMEKAGADALELSGGVITGGKLSPSRTRIDAPEKEAYFRREARAFREVLKIPIILVGGIRSLQVAATVVEEGTADLIAMSRPFIREPALVARWASGDWSPARCRSDNLCFGPAFKGRGIYCVTEEKERPTG